ncbi:MAG: adenylate kinase [Candidatus Hodarchaeales archaeon]
MIFILLGPPGSGKGTAARNMVEEWGIPQISTGDILRMNVKEDSELGRKAKTFMDEGDLVPDFLILEMVRDRLSKNDCHQGFILDGFPRTITQADGLGKILKSLGLNITAVLEITAPYDIIKKRIAGRRTCSNQQCQAIFNVYFFPPKEEGKCDKCGNPIIQRTDETEEVVTNRLEVYEEKTTPLIKYYKDLGILRNYSNLTTSDELHEEIKKDFS